jgi:hypothetical protein
MSEYEFGAGFAPAEQSATVQLGKLEALYEELFAEVIEDGVITAEEREQLERAAESLGLDRERLRQLERALQAAYESRHKVTIREEATPAAAPAGARDERTTSLVERIQTLEQRVAELEAELAEARATEEVDLSDLAVDEEAAPGDEDISALQRRVHHDPHDLDSLHALFRAYGRRGDEDRRWCVAHALVFLGAATDEELAVCTEYKQRGVIRPKSPVGPEAFRRLLFHPEMEPLVGEILSVVAPAVLLGRVSALRRDKALPKLDPKKRLDPTRKDIHAVRAFSWASDILGAALPPLYPDPECARLVEIVPGLPPVSRLGQPALAGRTPAEMAFVAGEHLVWYREDFFLRALLPSVAAIEDVFLAALSIGNPSLPLGAAAKARVLPIAAAIEPLLEPAAVDRLRGHFLRFVEEGGRANLQRYATAADRTAARAGFLLANDLHAVRAMLELQDPATVTERIDDLIEFVVSDRYAQLRRLVGVATASD